VLRDKKVVIVFVTLRAPCITQRLKNRLNATLVKQLPVTDANNMKSIMDIVTLQNYL
jgi:hypothetical protein